MASYRSYPRIVGETGGKDFIVAHPSADPAALAVAIVRGGFEFQGQKCSAASRVYIPRSLWNDVRDRMVAMIDDIKMGDVRDFRNFMGAVIDERAFDKICGYIDHARKNATIVAGGECDDSKGYFIQPTLVETDRSRRTGCCARRSSARSSPRYVYDDAKWSETLALVDSTSPYALTGRGVRAGSAGDRRGDRGAALRRRQLLHQRQADRRGRRPAAVRRRARVGHERQGRVEAQSGPLGQRADDQGELQPATRLPVSVHGRGVDSTVSEAALSCAEPLSISAWEFRERLLRARASARSTTASCRPRAVPIDLDEEPRGSTDQSIA